MDFSRYALLATLAMSPLAPIASGAHAATVNAAAATSSTNAPIAPGVLAPEVLAKVLNLISLVGSDRDLPAPIAGSLGLAVSGQPWPDRQFAVQWTPTRTLHAVAISRGADPDLIFSVRGPAAVTIFRTHRDGTLVSATNFFMQTNQAVPLRPDEARAGFAAERAFWTNNIDALVAQN